MSSERLSRLPTDSTMCEYQRYQKTVFMGGDYYEAKPPPVPPVLPPPKSIPYVNGSSKDRPKAEPQWKPGRRYRSEWSAMTGKPYEKVIEIPMTREAVVEIPTTPPIISANTTVMSYKKVINQTFLATV